MKRFSEILILLAAVCMLLLPIGVHALGERAAEAALEEEIILEEYPEADEAEPGPAPEETAAAEPAEDEAVPAEEVPAPVEEEALSESVQEADEESVSEDEAVAEAESASVEEVQAPEAAEEVVVREEVIESEAAMAADGAPEALPTEEAPAEEMELTLTIDGAAEETTAAAEEEATDSDAIDPYASPTDIEAMNNTTTGVKVTWTEVGGAAKYRVYCKAGTGSWKSVGVTEGTTLTVKTFNKKALVSGTKYTFTVKAYDADGTVIATNKTGKSITYIKAPAVPTVKNITAGMKVTWKAVGGAAKYRVLCKVGTGKWVKVGETTGTSLTVKKYNGAALKSGTKYTFTVKAIGSDGTASGYNTKGTARTRLTTPKLVSATASSGKVTVKWSKVTGATGYYVYRKTAGGTWAKVGTVKKNATVTYTDTTVKKGTTYYYMVKAYKSTTVSGYNTKGLSVKAE